MKNNRYSFVELLRFIFACVILFHHANISSIPMKGGNLAVEFFFMLSGIFIAKKIDNTSYNKEKIANETFNYTLRRYISILPYLFFGTIFGIIVNCVILQCETGLIFYFRLIGDFLALQSFGLPVASITGVVWYISSMLIGILVVYPITKKYYKFISKYGGLIIALLIISFLNINFKSITLPDTYCYGFLNTGNLRSIAMMFLGVWIYDKSKLIRNVKSNKINILLKIGNIFIFGLIIYLMNIWNNSFYQYDYIIVLLFMIALIFALGLEFKFNDKINSIFNLLGNYSIALYVSHYYYVSYATEILIKFGIYVSDNEAKIIGIFLSFITANIVLLLSNLLIKTKLYKNIMNRLNTN